MNLVTGATGHIGNVLVRELLAGGQGVRALVRSGKMPPALAGLDAEIVPGDVLDEDSLERAMRGVSLVYHLAARISLATWPDRETERVNLEGTNNVISAMRRSGATRLVYASSVYALRKPANGFRIDETQPFDVLHCLGAYDRSKARASLAVQSAVADGLDAVIVCPTAVTGPYDFQNSEAGRAIRLYMQPGLKFTVKGAYDFIDVRDAADGFILAAENGRRGETYILSGDRLTVREVVHLVWQATQGWHANLEVPLWLAYWVAGLMPFYANLTNTQPIFTRYSLDAICSNSHFSHAKATRELGFQARPASQVITDAVRWFQQGPAAEVPIPATMPKTAI
ncbi:MAG: NAD-dependent epimerase/dehydratase family protein [Anaerolineales bacterium]|jgi:dihydroflavonol-4-reductase